MTISEDVAPTATSHPVKRRAGAVAVAVASALIAWIVLVPLLGVRLRVQMGPGSEVMTIGPGLVLGTALVGACWAGGCWKCLRSGAVGPTSIGPSSRSWCSSCPWSAR